MNKCSVETCEYKQLARGYCSTHYKRFMKYGDANIKQERENKLDYDVKPNGCFECTSHRVNSQGYFFIGRKGKKKQMHRFIYEEMFGEIPENMVVRHKCDNQRCINPEHLEIGTIADNNRDRDERGRSRPSRGSKNGFAKLKESEVSVIKELFRKGKSVNELTTMFNIGPSTLYYIKRGERWKHVK